MVNLKTELLKAVFDTYDLVASTFTAACTRDCSTCCTQNVLATTVEVDLILQFLEQSGRHDLLAVCREKRSEDRLKPALTINELAEHCLSRQEPVQSDAIPADAPCPLRVKDGCAIYSVRPFSCRSMWSERPCLPGGSAIVNPLVVTLNGVLEQIIEHVDDGGLSGNVLDVLALLSDRDRREAFAAFRALEPAEGLRATRPNPGFIVLPEHRPHVLSLLNRLWERDVGSGSFRQVMARLRTE